MSNGYGRSGHDIGKKSDHSGVMKDTKNRIHTNVFLIRKLNPCSMYSNIQEFQIPKAFDIKGHARKAPKILQVDMSPTCNWVEYNTDEATKGAPDSAACGGIFRDKNATFIGYFSANVGTNFAFNAELMDAIISIEIAYERGWTNF
ncbi:putative ribonuclease H protein [Glycine soja]